MSYLQRRIIGFVFSLAFGLIVGFAFVLHNSWPWTSALVVAACFAVPINLGIHVWLAEHKNRVPTASGANALIINSFVPTWLSDRFRHILTEDKNDPSKSETIIRFMCRWHWSRLVSDLSLPGLIGLLAIWLSLGHPGSPQLAQAFRDHLKTALLIVCAGIAFALALALNRRWKQKVKQKRQWLPISVGVLLLWAAAGAPGVSVAKSAFGAKGSALLWLIVAGVAVARLLWKATDWIYTVIMLTDQRLLIVKRGPLLMPNKTEKLFIADISTSKAIETTIGKWCSVAGLFVNAPGQGDEAFHDMWPLKYGLHATLDNELNLLKPRRMA